MAQPQPRRLRAMICIGCGLINAWGSCLAGCREEPTEITSATEFDQLTEAKRRLCEGLEACSAPLLSLARFAGARPGESLEELRGRARSVLKAQYAAAAMDLPPGEVASAWVCPDCGALDAPQVCLGICIHRPAEFVFAADYERLQEETLQMRERLRDELRVLRQLAFSSPKPGMSDRHRSQLAEAAAAVLA